MKMNSDRRRFPPPWSVEDTGACFVGQKLGDPLNAAHRASFSALCEGSQPFMVIRMSQISDSNRLLQRFLHRFLQRLETRRTFVEDFVVVA